MPALPIISALMSGVINAVVDSSLQPSDRLRQESAMLRLFPANAELGEMQPPVQGEVLISGQWAYSVFIPWHADTQYRQPDCYAFYRTGSRQRSLSYRCLGCGFSYLDADAG
jgi:hypothetical protein